jgi:hypothetical protein
MADHPSPEFRRTAVWAMGETGDREFLGCLCTLLARESGTVRINVLRSLARIRKRVAASQPAHAPPPEPARESAVS